ncbi:MAG: ATP-binding cassette domain-containing protein, partial [Verrucomicrobiota bacterium]
MTQVTDTNTELRTSSVEPDEPLLVAQDLVKSYRRKCVVNQVSLSVERNEIVGLLGPNGAGKTTSFYMIAGLIRGDDGTVTFKGRDVTRMPMYMRARLGMG